MSKQIEGVSENIIKCAREEFLQKGFSEASLRTIAANAGTTTGSIYSRFGDKEGLFDAIVGPASDWIMEMFTRTQEDFHELDGTMQQEQLADTSSDGMLEMLDYMYEHFQEFQLLLDASHGTRYQNFVDRLVDIETEYTYKYMQVLHLPKAVEETITKEFVHIMNTSLFESMFEVIRHKMTKEDAVRYVTMLVKYHYAGWNAIFQET